MFSQVIIFILCNYVGCVDIIPIMLQNYYTGPIHPPYYALECRLHVRGNRVRKFFENYPMHNYWMNRSASLQYLRKIKSPKLILKWNSASILIEIEHLTFLKQNCFFSFFLKVQILLNDAHIVNFWRNFESGCDDGSIHGLYIKYRAPLSPTARSL